jgi:TolB-like protein
MERPFSAYKGDDPYIFVSYAHDDAALVYPEITRLKDHGFNVWYDEGIGPGLTWRDEVALALTQCKVFLYFITPRSVASSNCLKEVNFCLSRERKILSVHLEKTDLPVGLELSLSDMQAIVRSDHSGESYQRKLTDSLDSLLPATVELITDPRSQQLTDGESEQQSIAILPLVNRSNDPDNQYLCEGISEELIGGLAAVEGLKVASQLSSFALKNQNIDVRLMGEKLDVDHILSGSVQKADNRVRISVLLSRVKDGSSLWSKRYDRELEDIFELQEDVARQVIDALKIELGADETRQLLDVGTQNAQAYEIFLVGLHRARDGTRKSLNQATTNFLQAAQLDPDFARVHWWLYFCYWRLIGVGQSRAEMEPKADEALSRAEATGFIPPVPWIKARRDLYPETRPELRALAIEAGEKIRQPEPGWRLFEYIQLGDCLIAAGFNHGACDYYEYYLDRVQHDLSATWIVQRYRYLLQQVGRFDKAIELATEALTGEMEFGERACLYSRTGQYKKAEQDLTAIHKINPKPGIVDFYYLYWRRELDASKLSWVEDHEPQYQCQACFLLGDFDAGFNHLEEEIRRGVHPAVFRSNIGAMLPRSILRSVEAHPRFQAILKQFGIDDTWCDELRAMANDLRDVTGIHVQPDDDY